MDLSRYIGRSVLWWWLSGAVLVITSTALGYELWTEKWYAFFILSASIIVASYIVAYYSEVHKFLAGFSYLPLFILIWALGDYINAVFWEVNRYGILILLLGPPMLLGTTLGWGVSKHKHTVGMYVKSRPWEFGLVFCFIVFSLSNLYVFCWVAGYPGADESIFAVFITLPSLVVSIAASCIAVYYSDSVMRRLLGWSYVILLPVIASVAITAAFCVSDTLYLVTSDSELSDKDLSDMRDSLQFSVSYSLTIGLIVLGYLGQRRLLKISGIMLVLVVCASFLTAFSRGEGAGFFLYPLLWYDAIISAGAIIGIVLGHSGHLCRYLLQKRESRSGTFLPRE